MQIDQSTRIPNKKEVGDAEGGEVDAAGRGRPRTYPSGELWRSPKLPIGRSTPLLRLYPSGELWWSPKLPINWNTPSCASTYWRPLSQGYERATDGVEPANRGGDRRHPNLDEDVMMRRAASGEDGDVATTELDRVGQQRWQPTFPRLLSASRSFSSHEYDDSQSWSVCGCVRVVGCLFVFLDGGYLLLRR